MEFGAQNGFYGAGIRIGKKYADVGHGVFSIPNLRYCKEVEDAIKKSTSLGYRTPTQYQLKVLSFYISELKTNGIWSKGDLMYFFGYNSQWQQDVNTISVVSNDAREQGNLLRFCDINLLNPSRFLGVRTIEAGTVNCHYTRKGLFKAFLANNNTTNYFSTGYDPSLNAINYEINSASVTAYVTSGENLLDASNGSTGVAGLVDSNISTGIRFNPWSGTNSRLGFLNNTVNEVYGGSVATQNGYHHFERTASNASAWYVNGVSVQTRSSASTSILPGQVRLVRRFSNSLGFFRLGASLGSSLQKIDYDIFTNFRTKLGYQ